MPKGIPKGKIRIPQEIRKCIGGCGFEKQVRVTDAWNMCLDCYRKSMSMRQKGIQGPVGHKQDCKCCICKATRGEFAGENNPMFGVHRFGKENPMWGKHQSNEAIVKIKQNTTFLSGENSPHWKGGITSLTELLRTMVEYRQWRNDIFKRDHYTCTDCGYKGRDIEAHHIKEFAKILVEFLQTYPQFSPIEDKETLVRLAITYPDFWGRTNGKTLCKECHTKTKTYCKRIH